MKCGRAMGFIAVRNNKCCDYKPAINKGNDFNRVIDKRGNLALQIEELIVYCVDRCMCFNRTRQTITTH